MNKFDYSKTDYIEVSQRIVDFRERFPDGSLQPANSLVPYKIETIRDETYIVVVAAAYRSPQDVRPGIGMAYEVFPGKTPYTRGSELQNAETSAWGRAIVAALAADTKRGIASADEVRNRQAERTQSGTDPQVRPAPTGDPGRMETVRKLLAQAKRLEDVDSVLTQVEKHRSWFTAEQITELATLAEEKKSQFSPVAS